MHQIKQKIYQISPIIIICSSFLVASCSEQDDEVEIPASALSEEIKSVVNEKFPGIEITEVEIEGDPDLRYELSGNKGNKEIEIDITPNGKIIEIEQDEINIPLDAVPEHIISAIKKKYPELELSEAEIESSQTLRYEIEGKHDGKEIEIEIGPDGSILEIEQEDDDASDD